MTTVIVQRLIIDIAIFMPLFFLLDIRASRHTGPVRQEPDGR
jgi:hypothetical protein